MLNIFKWRAVKEQTPKRNTTHLFKRAVLKVVLYSGSYIDLTVPSNGEWATRAQLSEPLQPFMRWYFGREQSQQFLLQSGDGRHLIRRDLLQTFHIKFYKE